MKSISTPPLIYSLQRVKDTELSRDELNSLAKMLAGMIYRNLKMKTRQTEGNPFDEEKPRIDHDIKQNKQR